MEELQNETEVEETQEQEVLETQATEGTETQSDPVEESAEPQEFVPDYKYKVYDEEREIPEYLRTVITDKDTEEQIRSLMCKADGIDGIKEKYNKSKSEVEELRPIKEQYEPLQQEHGQMKDFLLRQKHFKDNKDLIGAMELQGFNQDDLLRAAQRVIQMNENPDDYQNYTQARQANIQAYEAQQQLQTAEQQRQDYELRLHNIEMDQAFNSPDVNTFQKEFDARQGDGAFRKAVTDHGTMVFHTQGRYIKPSEAVSQVVQQFQSFINPATSASQPPQVQQSQAPQPATIPNVGTGHGVSPTRPRYKSLDEMRKGIAQQLGS